MSSRTSVFTKFGRLTLPSKIGVLGGIASIVGLAWLFIAGGPGGTSKAAPSSTPNSHQLTHSGNGNIEQTEVRQEHVGGDAVVNTGDNSTITLVKGASAAAAKRELRREIIGNMLVGDEHLGGIEATVSTCQLWPSQAVAEALSRAQAFVQDRPFATQAYATAKTHPELTDADGWEHVAGFYQHIRDGVVRNRRELTATCEQLLSQGVDKDLLKETLLTWVANTEGNYHALNITGQVALQRLGLSEDEVQQSVVSRLKFLPSAAGWEDGASEMLEERFAQRSPFELIDSLTKADVLQKLRGLSAGDFDGHARLAMRARNMGHEDEARLVFENLADGMVTNDVVVRYAKVGIDQLNNPEAYSSLRGLFVAGFVEGASAGRDAGLQQGDVLIGYDGLPINEFADLERAKRLADSDEVKLLVVRRGERMVLRCAAGPLGTETWEY